MQYLIRMTTVATRHGLTTLMIHDSRTYLWRVYQDYLTTWRNVDSVSVTLVITESTLIPQDELDLILQIIKKVKGMYSVKKVGKCGEASPNKGVVSVW